MTGGLLILSMFPGLSTVAQIRSLTDSLGHTELYQFNNRFEKIAYSGKHDEFMTVSTYKKDSTLYRVDTYKLVDEVSVYGYQRDSKKVAVREGPAKVMYANGQIYLSCEYHQNALDGPFIVFYSDGTLKRREFYKRGIRKQGHCYTEDGREQTCEPFYQPVQFTGKRKDLETYLENSLKAVVDGEQVRFVQMKLTINEIGQVINTTVVSNSKDPVVTAKVQQAIRNIPQWNPNGLNWKPATMDAVPVSDIWGITMSRYRGFLRFE